MSEVVAAAPAAPATPAPAAAPVTPVAPAAGAPSAAQTPADSAAAAPTEGEKPATQDPAEKRGNSRFERRISRLHREAAEARAERDLLKRQLDERKPAAAPVTGEPRLQDYDYDPEKYAAAKAEFAKSQVEKEVQSRQQTETAKQFEQRLVSRWEENIDAVDEKYSDWNEKVGDLQPTTPFAVAIMEAENSADVAYYLGSNPKEATRIAQLHPLAQAREIGKIEARLLAAPPALKQPSKAPAPITPLSGSAPPSTEYKDGMSMPEYMKWREAKGLSARRR